jgi:hypothetical protein
MILRRLRVIPVETVVSAVRCKRLRVTGKSVSLLGIGTFCAIHPTPGVATKYYKKER